MAEVEVHRHGRVAELRLTRNALNTISPSLVGELQEALHGLDGDTSAGAMVLASDAAKFFSAGWDLPELLKLDEGAFREFYRSFNALTVRLAAHPLPTFAAIEGFAVAGGAILALACDWRIMTSGKAKLGLTEVDLGLPVPLPAALLAREVAGWPVARELLLAGRLFGPLEALEARLVVATLEPVHVRTEALDRAHALASKPPGAVAVMKRSLQAAWLAEWEAGRAADEAAFVEAFFHAETRPLLEAAAEKLVPR